MAFFDEIPEGKYKAETISMDCVIFSDFKNYSALCGVKSQLAWAKRPNAEWKRVQWIDRLGSAFSCTFSLQIVTFVAAHLVKN